VFLASKSGSLHQATENLVDPFRRDYYSFIQPRFFLEYNQSKPLAYYESFKETKMNRYKSIVDTNQSGGQNEDLSSPWSLLGVSDADIDDALNVDDPLLINDDKRANGTFSLPDEVNSSGKYDYLPEKLPASEPTPQRYEIDRRSSLLTKRKSISFSCDDIEPTSWPSSSFNTNVNFREEVCSMNINQNLFHNSAPSDSNQTNVILPDLAELQLQYQRSLHRFSNSMRRSDQTRSIVKRQCSQLLTNNRNFLSTDKHYSNQQVKTDDGCSDSKGNERFSKMACRQDGQPIFQLSPIPQQSEREHTRKIIYDMLCHPNNVHDFMSADCESDYHNYPSTRNSDPFPL
jgi:hypothetical protein